MPTVGHYSGPGDKIKTIHKDLSNYQAQFKASKKGDKTHLFFIFQDDDSIFPAILGNEWTRCASCDLCNSKTESLKYVLYPPLVLLPTNSKASKKDAEELLQKVKNCTHVAINSPIIEGDRVRRPQIIPLIGDFGKFSPVPRPNRESLDRAFYASSIQNRIYQTWAPMYTMFSRGNITEKRRVLDTFANQEPITGKTVVDLYAGIGYFTFSYAKQKPRKVYCWEINWWSVEGLLRAATVNGFKARVVHHEEQNYIENEADEIVVFLEDNQYCLERLQYLQLTDLTHINMGLLPHARGAFNVAKALVSKSEVQPVVHVHENVRIIELEQWKAVIMEEFGTCLYVEKIKEYSPGVLHLCGDFQRT